MLLDELRAKKDAIAALSDLYGARRIRVFGSVARGEERPDSDVDILVDFPRGGLGTRTPSITHWTSTV